MPKFTYWADSYLEKRRSAREAIDLIQPGQRVFIGSSCDEPQALVRELANASERCAGLEVVRLMALESTPLTLIANKTEGQNLSIRSFYVTPDPENRKALPETSDSSPPFICRPSRGFLEAAASMCTSP
ncbi:hypothetical protein D3OALGA1CA_3149 [Olavius algarvensis associated proteobacterium Delta 3]|nr:hypothetical protein D3OALGA1CA_3149 [Olavius algarvensis associated proteobacterium Delta 3]